MANRELFMVENDESGIWYFTSITKAANWMHEDVMLFRYYMSKAKREGKTEWKVRDYTVSLIQNTDDIIYKYIDPERL